MSDDPALDLILQEGTPGLLLSTVTDGRMLIRRHSSVIDDCVMRTLQPGGRLLMHAPPRVGKSTLISLATPLWLLRHFPTKQVAIISYNADYAASWSESVRDLMIEHGHRWGLEVDRSSSSKSGWKLAEHGGGVRSFGLMGGSITGRGFDLIIIDDPYRDEQQANSATYRQHVANRYRSTIYTRRNPGASIIVTYTRWHEDDLGSELVRMPDAWESVTIPAVCVDPETDPMGRKEGESIWPERIPESEYKEVRETVGEYWWQALYQGAPSPPDGGVFRREHLQAWWIDDGMAVLPDPMGDDRAFDLGTLETVLLVDTADSQSTTADYTVAMTVSFTPDGDLLVRDVYRERVESPDHVAMVQRLWDIYRHDRVLVEDKTFGTTLLKQARRTLTIPMQPVRVDKDKVTRARAAATRYGQGRVWHLRDTQWRGPLEEELMSFPTGAHDDQVDCLSMAAAEMLRVSGGGVVSSALPQGRIGGIGDRSRR